MTPVVIHYNQAKFNQPLQLSLNGKYVLWCQYIKIS